MAQAKFDIRTEATRQFYAGVGITDLAVEVVRDYVTDMQKRITELQKSLADMDFEPEHLRKQAATRFEALSKDAKARRKAVEKRMAELQAEAKAFPTKVSDLVTENVETVNHTMDDLVKRGESLVGRIRKQTSTKEALKEAKVTVTKAKTTRTQATKATKAAASKTRETAQKAVATPRSSAKATVTSARKTAASAAKAVVEAVEKVGD
ncbi:MAG: hypothetical protein U0R80_02490 [Nocardioidaceae bacterium]